MKSATEVIAASIDRARHGAEDVRRELEAAKCIARNLRAFGAPKIAVDELLSRVGAALRALERVEGEVNARSRT